MRYVARRCKEAATDGTQLVMYRFCLITSHNSSKKLSVITNCQSALMLQVVARSIFLAPHKIMLVILLAKSWVLNLRKIGELKTFTACSRVFSSGSQWCNQVSSPITKRLRNSSIPTFIKAMQVKFWNCVSVCQIISQHSRSPPGLVLWLRQIFTQNYIAM